MTLGMVSKIIQVGITVKAENELLTYRAMRFTHRINILLTEMYLLTKLENHISKMLLTLAVINLDSIWMFERDYDGVLNHIWV